MQGQKISWKKLDGMAHIFDSKSLFPIKNVKDCLSYLQHGTEIKNTNF